MDSNKTQREVTKTCMNCGLTMNIDEDCSCLLEEERRGRERRDKKRALRDRNARKQKQEERLF